MNILQLFITLFNVKCKKPGIYSLVVKQNKSFWTERAIGREKSWIVVLYLLFYV